MHMVSLVMAMPSGATSEKVDNQESVLIEELNRLATIGLPAIDIQSFQRESEEILTDTPLPFQQPEHELEPDVSSIEPKVSKPLDAKLVKSLEPKRKRRVTRSSRKKKLRPAPPGQRLIKYLMLALALLIVPALFKAQGEYIDLSIGRIFKVKLEPPFVLRTKKEQLDRQLAGVKHPGNIEAGVFAINLRTGDYVNIGGKNEFSAASMIKVPILVSFLAALDRGECSLSDELIIRDDLITSGSGFLQWRKPGSKISAENAAKLMMTHSDNTATNLLIDHVGGKEHLNRDFYRWGLKRTRVNNLLVDLEGTNKTCPYDLVYLLGRVDHGELISKESRAFMYDVMGKCRNRSLIPTGLGPGATIIHKTGTIGMMLGDVGIVTTPEGVRYAVGIQTIRPRNDRHANELIRRMSALIYDDFRRDLPVSEAPKSKVL